MALNKVISYVGIANRCVGLVSRSYAQVCLLTITDVRYILNVSL